MRENIHPKYEDAVITCACGNVIHTKSTKAKISVDVCSKCHPFFTDRNDGTPILGDFLFVSPEAALNLPAKAVNAVLREKEGKLLLDLGYLPIAAKHRESGHPPPDLLLN